jgi:hypothetical protein
LIRLFKCKEAIGSLENIVKYDFPNEIDTINQVISYNMTCLEEDPNHIQSYFIIGALIYKKLNNPIYSYEKLELFVKKAEQHSYFDPLTKKAKEYLAEIDKLIG